MTTTHTRVAIITGASRGIGAVIARQLASEGFAVAINYASSAREASALVVELRQAGHKAMAVQADVANAADVARLFTETEQQLGKVDVLINNAGMHHRDAVGTTQRRAVRPDFQYQHQRHV